MDAYIPEEDNWDDDGEMSISADPLEGLTRGEQDTFFRVLDLVSDEQRPAAIDYFMDHPAKIRAVIDGVKKRKEMIKNKDIEALNALFAQERVEFEKMVEQYGGETMVV